MRSMREPAKNDAIGHGPAAQALPARRLYIIDDDDGDRRRSTDLLDGGRFHIQPFDSGRSFIAKGELLDDACVLLDVWMPEMDGLTVLGHILTVSPGCPVIMLSGKSTLPIAVEAMKRGAVDFLEKPVLKTNLVDAVERAFSLKPAARPETLTREELLNKVTRREGQVLELLVRGHPNKVVAFQLGIAENTVEVHRQRLMRRLDVKSFADLVRLAVKAGI
jgi:two-component system, LuxR family, response regulator FixJ